MFYAHRHLLLQLRESWGTIIGQTVDVNVKERISKISAFCITVKVKKQNLVARIQGSMSGPDDFAVFVDSSLVLVVTEDFHLKWRQKIKMAIVPTYFVGTTCKNVDFRRFDCGFSLSPSINFFTHFLFRACTFLSLMPWAKNCLIFHQTSTSFFK